MGRSSIRKIVIYSQDGFGLGHLRRNLNIAIQLHRRAPGARILLIADSPAAPFFRLPPRCDFVKIPTLVKVTNGVWRSDRLSLEDREILRIRSELIRDTVLAYRPDLFLADHMPCGALGELALLLEAVRRRRPMRFALGLRDVLGDPAEICRQWHQDQHYVATTAHYDSIFIYGCRDMFDLVEKYQFPEPMIARAHYCGYVSREHVPMENGDARAERKRKPMVLVTGGGGADACFFIDKFLDATARLKDHLPFRAVVTTGPFMHADQHRWLQHKARGLPVRIIGLSQDDLPLMRHAEVIVSMAGYNTISEILRFRKKAIVIPRPGPSAEQTIRTRIMGERGLFTAIHPHKLTADNLAEAIAGYLRQTTPLDDARIPPLDGASRAAALMLGAPLEAA